MKGAIMGKKKFGKEVMRPRIAKAVAKINRKYGKTFKRLAE
jgi:hypothetical protein